MICVSVVQALHSAFPHAPSVQLLHSNIAELHKHVSEVSFVAKTELMRTKACAKQETTVFSQWIVTDVFNAITQVNDMNCLRMMNKGRSTTHETFQALWQLRKCYECFSKCAQNPNSLLHMPGDWKVLTMMVLIQLPLSNCLRMCP